MGDSEDVPESTTENIEELAAATAKEGAWLRGLTFFLGFLWRWEVVGAIFTIAVGGAALAAIYGNDFILAGFLFAIGIFFVVIKTLTWEVLVKDRARLWASLFTVFFGVLCLGGCEYWVHYKAEEYKITSTTKPDQTQTRTQQQLGTTADAQPSGNQQQKSAESPAPVKTEKDKVIGRHTSNKPATTNGQTTSQAQQPAILQPTTPQPSMGCAPGSNCAQSIGQLGGVTAGQINIGAHEWATSLNGEKQQALIGALGEVQGKIRITWLLQDVDGMRMAGFLNYAFMQAKWTSDEPDRYAGSMCYPDRQSDCTGMSITVKDRNSKIAQVAIGAVLALVPDAQVGEDDKIPEDRVDIFITKAK
jgi:hypothetical protein